MSKQTLRLLLTGTAIAASVGSAHAQAVGSGTAAGTVVTNTAQASYTVNGAAQTASSNTATFVVDRKVNLTVVAVQTSNTQVSQGQTGAVLTYKVTNTTNGTQDFNLSADQTVTTGVLPVTSNFGATNLRIFVDSNGNGVYDPGVDTATYIDELPEDGSATVFVVGDVPNTAGETYDIVSLKATVAAGGTPGTQGTALVPTDPLLPDNQAAVDIVFADNDSDGLLGPDIARNGSGRAYAAYEVSVHNVALSVVKSSLVLSDGVNLTNPKALPGAVVQYCLTVNNATLGTAANGITLTDVVPANTTYVPGSIQVGALGGAGVCLTGGVPIADDGSTIGLYGGSFNTTSKTVTATIPTLLGGTSLAASFRVTIN